MASSILSLVSVASSNRQVEARERVFDARLTSRNTSAIRLDVAARDLSYDGFDAEGSRPFAPSELFDVAFRGDDGWTVRLRVRVVDSQWMAVKNQAVCYLTRFQFVHSGATATRDVIDALLD